ncbi:hypothetical protein [Burkholderia sp. AW49-1]
MSRLANRRASTRAVRPYIALRFLEYDRTSRLTPAHARHIRVYAHPGFICNPSTLGKRIIWITHERVDVGHQHDDARVDHPRTRIDAQSRATPDCATFAGLRHNCEFMMHADPYPCRHACPCDRCLAHTAADDTLSSSVRWSFDGRSMVVR